MWVLFKQAIFQLLQQIEAFVGDWGLAIVVLTVIVRVALMPLTIKQTRSMYELQRIQPKIKELQKKYANDKEKLQEETLKFYQENKINPFGGCLPMLLQMPLFIALYQVLGGAGKGPSLIEHLTRTGEVGRLLFLIPDIAKTPGAVFRDGGVLAALPYIVLVLLFGLSVWLPQALMPGERQQKMIGLYMGVMMLFFGWSAPAGVLLYWDVSSIWQVVQQQVLMAALRREEAAEPAAPAPGASAGSERTRDKKRPKR